MSTGANRFDRLSRAGAHPWIRLEELEQGQVFLDRFCILDGPEKTKTGWRVTATDLRRDYGGEPGHRVSIEEVRGGIASEALDAVLARALPLNPRVCAAMSITGGLVIVAEYRPRAPIELAAISTPQRQECLRLARELCCAMDEHGISVEISEQDLSWCDGSLVLRGFSHLRPSHVGDADGLSWLSAFLSVEEHTPDVSHYRFPVVPPLVGRSGALANLGTMLQDARQARPRAVLLCGSTGIGKSRLARHFAVSVSEAVVAVHADLSCRLGDDRSLLGALNLLPEQTKNWNEPESEALRARLVAAAGPLKALVSRALPAVASWLDLGGEGLEVAISEDLDRHAALVSSLIAAVGTAQRPLVLVVDNLDAAELGSTSILGALSNRIHHHTLVVAAGAEESISMLGPRAALLRLQELRGDEVEVLVQRVLGARIDDLSALCSELLVTGSSPLLILSRLRSWVESERLRKSQGTWTLETGEVHAEPIELCRVRLDRVSLEQRRILELMSARDGRASASWVARVLESSVESISRALDELVVSGMLVARGGGYCFAHNSVAEAVSARAEPESLRDAHERIAEWLRSQSHTSHAQLAYHAELGQVGSASERAPTHLQAGHELFAVFDLERARWHYELALARSEEGADAREGLANVALLLDQRQDALAGYIGAQESAPDVSSRLRIAARACYAVHNKWGIEAAESVATPALRAAGHRIPQTLVGQLLGIGSGLLWMWRGSRQADEVRDYLCRIYTVFASGFTAQPGKLLLSVLRGARLAGTLAAPGPSTALSFWAGTIAVMGRFDAARRVFERAEQLGSGAGAPWSTAVAKHVRAHWVELPDGNYQHGQLLLDQAIAEFEETGDLTVAALAYYFKANYGRDREPASVLFEWLERSEACAERHGSRLALFNSLSLRALIEARTRAEGALARVRAVSENLERAELIAPDEIGTRAALAHAYLELGAVSEARREVEAGLKRMGRGPVVEALLDIYFAGALVGLQSANGMVLYRRCARQLRRGGRNSRRMALAHRYARGLMFMNKGNTERAGVELSRLLRDAEELGERFLVAEGRRALARCSSVARVLEASEHERRAREIRRALELETPRLLSSTARQAASEERPASRLGASELVDELTRIASKHSGWVVAESEISGECTITGSRAKVAVLLNHLILAARDSRSAARIAIRGDEVRLAQSEAARISGARAGDFVRITAYAQSSTTSGPVVPGLSATRRAVLALDGFIEHGSRDIGSFFSAYLPVVGTLGTESQRLSVAVGHPNPRYREAVMNALAMLGHLSREIMSPGEAAEADLAIVDGELAMGFEDRDPPVIVLAGRAAAAGTDFLRVPFDVSELESLIAEALKPPSA